MRVVCCVCVLSAKLALHIADGNGWGYVSLCSLSAIFLFLSGIFHQVLTCLSESELLLVTRPNDNHSPGPVIREVSP